MTRPSPDDTTATLVRNLHMVSTLVQRLLVDEPLSRTVGDRLSFSQLNLLKLVGGRSPESSGGRQRPWLVSQLAKSLGVSAPAASQSISHLQEQGWLLVKRDREDARRRRVTLTAKARRAIDKYEGSKRSLLDQALKGTKPAEVGRWARTLGSLVSCLLHASDEPPCLMCGMYDEGSCVANQQGTECPVRGLPTARS